MLRTLLILSIITVIPCLLKSQGSPDIDTDLSPANVNVAAVQVDGEILFYVRGVSSFPADTRAKSIQKRIVRIADNPIMTPDSVKMIPDTAKIQIRAGDALIMNVYDTDAEYEGITKEILSEIIVSKIKSIIKVYRNERRPEVIRANIIKAGMAIALMSLILFIVIWGMRRINRFFNARMKKKLDTIENVSYNLIQSGKLVKALHVLYQVIRILFIAVTIILFAEYILGLFPWTKGFAQYILSIILDPIKSIAKGFVGYLPSLIFLLIIFFITRYLLKLFRLFFNGLSSGDIVIGNFDPEWAMPTFKIVRVGIIAFALVLAFPYIPGSETSAFKGVSVFLGVLFSLGSSSFIANIIAGYSMTYRRAFKVGDRIQVSDFHGYVEEQSLMVTRLRSFKNEEIVIPNSLMLNSTLVNYSAKAKDKGVIIHASVGIGYETPWRQVDAMLKLAADRTPGLLKDPPPFVLKRELGDFAVTYEINAYCHDVSHMFKHYTELVENILDIFNANKVQIMTPAYEGDPETPKFVPKDQWNTPLAEDS